MLSISIIGIGRVGGALAIALHRAGFKLDQLVFRGESNLAAIKKHLPDPVKYTNNSDLHGISSDICIVAVSDAEIGKVAADISALASMPKVVLHVSGVLSSDELSSVSSAGCAIGSMHPLVAISDAVMGAERFRKSHFCVEGDEEAAEAARWIVEKLGGFPFTIDTKDKPLYHASAVMAAGHLVALVDSAIKMLSACGIEEESAQQILFPLIKSNVSNLAEQKPSEALTGPFARGDSETFERHLAAFDGKVSEDIRRIYLDLARHQVGMMLEKDSDSEKHQKLAELISVAKEKSEC